MCCFHWTLSCKWWYQKDWRSIELGSNWSADRYIASFFVSKIIVKQSILTIICCLLANNCVFVQWLVAVVPSNSQKWGHMGTFAPVSISAELVAQSGVAFVSVNLLVMGTFTDLWALHWNVCSLHVNKGKCSTCAHSQVKKASGEKRKGKER